MDVSGQHQSTTSSTPSNKSGRPHHRTGRFAEDKKKILVPSGIRNADRPACNFWTNYTVVLLTKPKRRAIFPPLQTDDIRYTFSNAVTGKGPLVHGQRTKLHWQTALPSTTTNFISFVNAYHMLRPYWPSPGTRSMIYKIQTTYIFQIS